MRFDELLEYHRGVAVANSHADILGDAYLLRENAVYRRIKRRAEALGAVYRVATIEYLLLPFNQLEQILASKQIPYVPHARLMGEIEAKHPGLFSMDDMPMPESYHLHEGAHVIAASCTQALGDSREDRVLTAILCESFANTVDALACSYAETPVHRVLLKQNCYMSPREAELQTMIRVRSQVSDEGLVRLLLLSYLFANFLRDEVPADLIEATIRACAPADVPPTKKLLKDGHALTKVGQRLDPLFRVQTTQNFLRMAGFEEDVYDVLDFDFGARLARPEYAAALDQMVAVLCDEVS